MWRQGPLINKPHAWQCRSAGPWQHSRWVNNPDNLIKASQLALINYREFSFRVNPLVAPPRQRLTSAFQKTTSQEEKLRLNTHLADSVLHKASHTCSLCKSFLLRHFHFLEVDRRTREVHVGPSHYSNLLLCSARNLRLPHSVNYCPFVCPSPTRCVVQFSQFPSRPSQLALKTFRQCTIFMPGMMSSFFYCKVLSMKFSELPNQGRERRKIKSFCLVLYLYQTKFETTQ